MLKVLIVGHGTVGKAVASIFKKDKLYIAEPKENKFIKNYKDIKLDIIFICVDTPPEDYFLTLDYVICACNNHFCCPVVSKSTAPPTYYQEAKKIYNSIQLLHSPEYLNHWDPIQSFKQQEFIIMGGDKAPANKAIGILKKRLPKVKNEVITDIGTAALVKYAENAFLATKVTFANEFYQIHKKLKLPSSYDDFRYMLGLDKRIGHSHLQVPGPDKFFGWGGHCFNKDLDELKSFSNNQLVDYIINLNKIHRNTKHETIQTRKRFSKVA